MLFSIALTGFLLAACLVDLKAFRIPNVVPLALMALFLIKAAATSGLSVWPEHMIAFGVTFGFSFLAFALGLIGGGDAKLLSALALWVGMSALPDFLVITAVSGGVLAVTLLAVRYVLSRRPVLASPEGATRTPRLFERNAPVPYALPITFAALCLEWL